MKTCEYLGIWGDQLPELHDGHLFVAIDPKGTSEERTTCFWCGKREGVHMPKIEEVSNKEDKSLDR